MKCPRCGKPAYVGYTEVKCTNTKCVHFDQREADDFAARKTLPPGRRAVLSACGSVQQAPTPAPLSGFTAVAPWGTPAGLHSSYFSAGLLQCPQCTRTPSEYYIDLFGTPKCPQCGYIYTPPLGPAKPVCTSGQPPSTCLCYTCAYRRAMATP